MMQCLLNQIEIVSWKTVSELKNFSKVEVHFDISFSNVSLQRGRTFNRHVDHSLMKQIS